MKIVCLGDSLTEGDYGIPGKRGIANVHAENYPYFLGKILNAETVNYGKCGYRASAFLKFYEAGNVSLEGADFIVIMLGTNGGHSAEGDSHENNCYKKLVELCVRDSGKNAQVVLCTPPHASSNPEYSNCGYMPQIREAVGFVRSYSKITGLPLIDLAACPLFTEETESVMQPNDGLHFAEEGYKALAGVIAEALTEIKEKAADGRGRSGNMRLLKDIYYSGERDDRKTLDVYIPDGECKAVFLYIHGGGIEAGAKWGFYANAEYLAKNGYGSVSIDYPLYPNTKFPDFIYAAAEAVAWTKSNMKKFFGTERLYVGGDSAGGYISMMLCFDRRYLDSVGLSNSDISGYWHAAGQPTAHFNVLKYSGIDSRRVIVDETAPLYFVGMEEKYPYMRFTVSDNDMFGRYDQTMLMLKTLEHFGYKNFDHKVVSGTHCEFFRKFFEDGTSEASHLLLDFLNTGEEQQS